MTDIDFQSWLNDPSSIKVTLVEATANISTVDTVLYLSTGAYNTKSGETPVNTTYNPIIRGGISFTERISLNSEASLSVGDIEIDNVSGDQDTWLNYIWANRPVKAFIGDPRWARSEFRLIFNGIISDIGSRDRNVLNLKIRDKLQRLNTPISEVKLLDVKPGDTSANKNALLPLTFGEVHNVTPLLINPATLEYQVHNGSVESIFEVRDNGIPVSASVANATGKFILPAAPAGSVTVSLQGDKPTTYSNTVANLIQRIVAGYGKVTDRFSSTTQLTPGTYNYSAANLASFTRASVATYIGSDGLIRPSAINSPRIDYSTGSAKLLVEATSTNRVLDSATLTSWSGCTKSPSAVYFKDILYTSVAKATTTTSEGCASVIGNTVSGGCITAVAAFRAGTVSSCNFGLYNGTDWGNVVDSYATVLSGPGIVTNVTGCFWVVSNLSASVDTVVQITRKFLTVVTGVVYVYPGQAGSTVIGDSVLLTRVQVEDVASLTSPGTSYIPTTSTAVTRAADIATISNDIDSANFAAFNTAHPQQVGLYIQERTNVLVACQQLASSIGSVLSMSREGLLTLVQITLPAIGTPTAITQSDIISDSLHVISKSEVVAAVKLNFCKNYTVQAGLLTGIPTDHKDLYAEEWLTTNASDGAVLAAYKLNAEPVAKDTCLLTYADSTAEAARLLNIYKVPRFVYGFDGTSSLLSLKLGQAVTLTHGRYGLASGVLGIVIALTPNWQTGRIQVEVMV
jgi:hypothetical protein